MSILALSILAGCVSTPAGSAGYDAFMDETSPTRLTGPRDAAEAAQCFEDRAKFLPLTAEGAGTRAEWRISPNLDANWLDQFERDRMAPLRHCLGT